MTSRFPIALIFSALLLLWPTPASGGDDLIVICGDHQVFTVKDRIHGVNFEVTVLEGQPAGGTIPYVTHMGRPIRVAWGNQIPQTHDGVNVHVDDTTNGNRGEIAADAALSGNCGEEILEIGDNDSYTVTVNFAGVDITETNTVSDEHVDEVHAELGAEFEASTTGASESVRMAFGSSSSHSYGTGHSISWHSITKNFAQSYHAGALPQPTGACLTDDCIYPAAADLVCAMYDIGCR